MAVPDPGIDPFRSVADPAGYVARAATERVLDGLWAALELEAGPALALVGPPGIGKSTVAQVLAARTRGRRTVIHVSTGPARLDDLLDLALDALGDGPTDDPGAALQMRAALLERRGRPLLWIIDGADGLAPETISGLADLWAGASGALSLLLVATERDDLEARLEAFGPRLQRVSLGEPMSLAETRAYVEARLQRAAATSGLRTRLDDAAVARVHVAAGGLPAALHAAISEIQLEAWSAGASQGVPQRVGLPPVRPVPAPLAPAQPEAGAEPSPREPVPDPAPAEPAREPVDVLEAPAAGTTLPTATSPGGAAPDPVVARRDSQPQAPSGPDPPAPQRDGEDVPSTPQRDDGETSSAPQPDRRDRLSAPERDGKKTARPPQRESAPPRAMPAARSAGPEAPASPDPEEIRPVPGGPVAGTPARQGPGRLPAFVAGVVLGAVLTRGVMLLLPGAGAGVDGQIVPEAPAPPVARSAPEAPPAVAEPPVQQALEAPAGVGGLPDVAAPGSTAAGTPGASRAGSDADVYLNIQAFPWATIWVDDRRVGETPLADVRVAPGVHEVRAELPDGRVLRRRIDVRDGQRLVFR